MGRVSLGTLEWEFDDKDYDMACTFGHILECEMDYYFEENKDFFFCTTDAHAKGITFHMRGQDGVYYGEMDVSNDSTFCINDIKSEIFFGWVAANKDNFGIEFSHKSAE